MWLKAALPAAAAVCSQVHFLVGKMPGSQSSPSPHKKSPKVAALAKTECGAGRDGNSMKTLLKRVGLTLSVLTLYSAGACAQLGLASTQGMPNHGPYDLLAYGGQRYFIVPSSAVPSVLRLERIVAEGDGSEGGPSLPVEAILLRASSQRQAPFASLAALDAAGRWSLYRIEGQTPGIAAASDLSKSFRTVAAVASIGEFLVVAGANLEGRPLVCAFDARLRKVREAVLPNPSRGVATSVAHLRGAIVVAANPTAGPATAWIWRYSPTSNAVKGFALPGSGSRTATKCSFNRLIQD